MKNKLWKFVVCGVLLLPLFSCKQEKVFKDYLTYYEEVKLEDINSVGIKLGGTSNPPGTLVNKYYSQDEEDINAVYNVLNSKVNLTENRIPPGSSCTYYSIYIADGKYLGFYIYDDLVDINNGTQHLKVENTVSEFINPSLHCYSLSVASDNYAVLDKDLELVFEGINLSYLEFNEIDGTEYQDKEYEYLLSSYLLELELYSDSVFKLNDQYYELTEEYKFFY